MTKNQKGVRALVALVVLGSIAAQTAHAENKLFATDVLDRGQFDIVADQGFSEYKVDRQWKDMPLTAAETIHHSGSSVSARVGLGAQTHVGASLDYAVSRDRWQFDVPPEYYAPDAHVKAKGFQGWSLWVKHGFLTSASSPLSLSGGLQVDLDTDRNLNAEANNAVSASVSAGWDFGSGVKGFADVTHYVAEHAKVGQRTELSAGTWLPVGRSVTLAPSVNFTRWASQGYAPSVNQVGLALQGLVQLTNDTYVRSHLSVFSREEFDAKNGVPHVGSATGKALSIGLYHLF